jgi:phosphoribosylamine---glycine ligase
VRIFIVGSGGREHALAWRLSASGHEVLAAPGNPGVAQVAQLIDLAMDDFDALAALALERKVDVVVIGPEAPLVAGLADRLRRLGLAVFGPSASAARLEGSKVFAKEFFQRHGIRTAEFVECAEAAGVDRALAELGGRVVVKADGLAAGKGVVLCSGPTEARQAALSLLEGARFGAAGRKVVIERRLSGREVSILALCDGKRCELLPPVEDHKAVFDGDRGPNTGGMGTASPPSWSTGSLMDRARAEIFEPTLAGLRAEKIDYRGVLYAGLMVEDDGTPWILEYNCRFGDPETQPLMVRCEADLAPWLLGAARGEMPAGSLQCSPRAAVCVVMAAHGYPGNTRSGDRISGLEGLPAGVVAFHAGTARVNGALVTAGGRVLGVTALGDDLAGARQLAYQAVSQIHFDGAHVRRDIGARGLAPAAPAPGDKNA